MGVNVFGKLTLAGVVSLFGISAVHAAIPATEVVNLPTDAAYGGGDNVGSELIAACTAEIPKIETTLARTKRFVKL